MSKLEGISVRLPLTYDPIDGPFRLNKNIGQTVKQNFKNLLLTSPGERIMIPDFGVGLKRLLFENIDPRLREKVIVSINEQTRRFMPFVVIEDVRFAPVTDALGEDTNRVAISINYNLGSVDSKDTLTIA
jgi:uncharacterized protein|tara:strand:+ start:2575 stop:2964 length:390 start_codon:yes stop_codon:yes gene_type:complete